MIAEVYSKSETFLTESFTEFYPLTFHSFSPNGQQDLRIGIFSAICSLLYVRYRSTLQPGQCTRGQKINGFGIYYFDFLFHFLLYHFFMITLFYSDVNFSITSFGILANRMVTQFQCNFNYRDH